MRAQAQSRAQLDLRPHCACEPDVTQSPEILNEDALLTQQTSVDSGVWD